MKQESQKKHTSDQLSPPGMEHTTDLMSDFGVHKTETPKKEAPKTESVKVQSTAPAVKTVKNAEDAAQPQKKQATAQKKKPASSSSKKKTAKSNEKVQASTATGSSSPKKKNDTKKETVSLDAPRSAKPAHQIMPYVLAIFALLIGISLLLNLFCNFGNQLQDDPGAHWMGKLGYYICYGLFGMFGPAVFALPLILINLAIYWKKYIDHRLTISKIVVSILALVFLSSLIHVFCLIGLDDSVKNLSASFLLESGAKMTGGGLVGGKLGYFLYDIGSYVGGILISAFCLAASMFYFLGMTPQHLWSRIRLHRALRAERAPSLSKQEAEQAKYQAEMDEKFRRTATRQITIVDEVEGNPPEGAVRMATAAQTKKEKNPEEKLAPMPQPRLDPNDGSRLFVPSDINRKMHEGQPVSKELSEEKKADSSPVKEAPAAPPAPAEEKAPQIINPALNKDAAVDPIFPKSNESRQVRAIPREDRNFDLKNVFIDLDDSEKAPVREHAPLPPEVPLGVPTSRVATPAASARRPVAGIAAPRPGARPATRPAPGTPGTASKSQQTVFRQAAAPKQQSFGLSDEEFEQREAQQGNLPTSGDKKPATAGQASAKAAPKKNETASKPAEPAPKKYVFPPVSYLHPAEPMTAENRAEIEASMQQLAATLESFRVRVQEINYSCGPTVTRYEVILAPGVRVRTVTTLADDIALALRSSGGVRIEAPIPGTNAVGIEVPNKTRSTIYLRDLIESKEFAESKSKLSACLGADIAGSPLIFDIAKMPHLLIAGTTGSGKSVCINCIIMSLLYKVRPDEVKLVLIDPKKVEFSIYKNIPHLMAPVVTMPKDAAGALQAAVEEMERRFEVFENVGVRDLKGYNSITKDDPDMPYIPHIVIIIDELADLMMTARNEVETAICRIAQKARAAGMHLIIGTQRPSADVVTGLIKANVPSSIAFAVKSQIDSRVILDHGGAEALTGRGDMLFVPIGSMRDTRVQGAFVDDKEVEKICDFIRANNGTAHYDEKFTAKLKELAAQCGGSKAKSNDDIPISADGEKGDDPKYADAVRVAVEEKRVSTSLLQRKLEIGYGRAAKIIDRMQAEGIVSPPDGSKPRTILITPEQYLERFFDEKNEEN
ncbi:MAG: DNA translocase FtsK 4TM domain-containing protein [Clostridia bacterium]|nr:DNA translocase FtsK 4TM domain-containing protein [Clostridia bacterium]